jgi:hypothetical protein
MLDYTGRLLCLLLELCNTTYELYKAPDDMIIDYHNTDI